MSRRRTIIRLSAVLASLALGWACGGDSATAPPTPEPARPTTVTVSPATHGLTALGATVQLSAEVRDQNARVMAGATVTWTSSANSVATVDASGLVTAAGNGTATITASAGPASGSAVVTVTQSVASVEVSPSVDELTALGQTVQLTAEAFDENGYAVAGAEFSWESSDVAVATVDAGGLVTGVAAGMATITASAGEASGSAVVTVMQSGASVEVSPSAQTIALGSTLQLTAEAFDENGEAVAGVEFSWESSDAAVATVDAGGLVTGVAEGVATITASAGSGQGTAKVTVADLDRAALVALYEATDGPNWVNNEGWLTNAPLGDWYGVDVDGRGRVVRLDLSGRFDRGWVSHGLSGPIPSELAGLSKLESLNLRSNALMGAIPPEFGDLASLRSLDLAVNRLSGPIPREFGNLVRLNELWLSGNRLSGPIPPELGNLVNLTVLNLNGTDLSGSIPESLLQITGLSEFNFNETIDLCAPGTADFVVWLQGIDYVTGPYCSESEAEVLELLYQASGGSDWTNSSGWFETPVLAEWYGVATNSLGGVVALDLTDNGLAGRLPAELGSLAEMTTLRIGGNALAGRLPLSLAGLSLVELHYADTGLCAPMEPWFQAWLNGIPSREGTGAKCALTSDRDLLVEFYRATGGPDWYNNNNWLTDAPLRSWHGVNTDSQGRVTELRLGSNGLAGPIPPQVISFTRLRDLSLWGNELSGPIPPELGSLANLRVLFLTQNALSGPIPPELGELANLQLMLVGANPLTGSIPAELGNLANLRTLDLGGNALTGSIPSELADIAKLEGLYLRDNDLTGSIPPELGRLFSLETLRLDQNSLNGSIPVELGDLRRLTNLNLSYNNLTGPLPPGLGDLVALETLFLDSNHLSGPVPADFAGLANLKELGLTQNAGMSGELPATLTNLRRLEALIAWGTDLCAPLDADFQAWLVEVPRRRIALCADGDAPVPMAYLTQAVQSRKFPVPLVAGERALLRVFPTAGLATTASIPAVRAHFYLDGRETHMEVIPGKSASIPTEVNEGNLSTSVHAEIPGHVVQPGLEMVIEVDPDGTLDPALGVVKRIPGIGRMGIDVRRMPVFHLTVVPFLWSVDPDAAILELTAGMAADPEGHELLEHTRTLLPIGELDVTAHEPVLTSHNTGSELLHQTGLIRAVEGGRGHYMGMMTSPPLTGGVGGQADRPGSASFSVPGSAVIAHELGHNLSLYHAPCGPAGDLDPSYPYADGSTGAWGYDFREDGSLMPPHHKDLMSYCGPTWISDYHFTNALGYRLFDEGPPSAAAVAASSLLLWGGVGTQGEPFLEPAFVVDAPPALPDSAGEYRVTGRTASGGELFSLSFAMPEVAHGDGSSSFAFVLPARPGWAGALASITLSGPGGSVTVDGESDLPMAILRNPRTGQVRGILRDLPPATQAARDAAGRTAGPGLEVLISRGIPDAAAWRR